LIIEARAAAMRTRLAEVDLGTFRTTMPQDPSSRTQTDVELHIFGTVPRYRVPTIEKQLRTENYRFRHEVLQTIRAATTAELAEPDLAQLRSRIEKVVNTILSDAPIKKIGFFKVQVYYR
jgi:hypothetical protein